MIHFSRIPLHKEENGQTFSNVCTPHLIDIVAKNTDTDAKLHMLGSGGAERELALVRHINISNSLPVLLGLGIGHALRYILSHYDCPIAIIDKEKDILLLTKALHGLSTEEVARITLIDSPNTDNVLRTLTLWQNKHGGLPFTPIVHPFYMRLDRFSAQKTPWYGFLRKHVEASSRANFWGQARKPRFIQAVPRILLITSKYFLMGEVARACKNIHVDFQVLTLPNDSMSSQEFIESLLKAVVGFQPDCLLTLNHLGVDREGVLMDLLEQLQLPLASWFVDNPHLIIHLYKRLKSPWVTIFTWDADNISSLHHKGFEHVFHLPLGTDPKRFRPNTHGLQSWKSPLSFVGNSMVHKVAARLKKTPFPRALLLPFKDIAKHFDNSEERSVSAFIKREYPKIYSEYTALATDEERLGYETAITWEATRLYRARCVAQTLSFSPLLVGDTGWNTLFRTQKSHFTLIKELNYYDELPAFYPLSDINFNCTSKQMKGAVNQRIFDVPACHAFVLTDWRAQMDALFEPHKEIAFYTEPEEAGELIRYYLKNPTERLRIATAARKRVLAEHTWEHRLQKLLQDMRSVYGTKPLPTQRHE